MKGEPKMTVKELMEKLQKFDENMEVLTYDQGFKEIFRVDISEYYDRDIKQIKEAICIE